MMIDRITAEGVRQDNPPSATEDVAKLRLQLRHLSLEQLEMEGVVKWDRDEHIVKKGPNFYNHELEGGIG